MTEKAECDRVENRRADFLGSLILGLAMLYDPLEVFPSFLNMRSQLHPHSLILRVCLYTSFSKSPERLSLWDEFIGVTARLEDG